MHAQWLRKLRVWLIAGFLWCCLGVWSPTAQALTQVELTDLDYEACPPELAEGIVAAGNSGEANCFLITGMAQNTSGKPVYNADIFGRIYDANSNNVMQNRSRLGSIDTVPPGESPFTLRISVPTSQPEPLRLEKFKAAGFAGQVRR